MKVSFGILALLAIGAIGCNKEATNNMPAQPATNNNPPSSDSNNGVTNPPVQANNAPLAANNAPAAANNAPEATNQPPAANNAPVDQKKPDPKKVKPTIPDPEGPGKGNWTKSQMEAKKVAVAVDTKMKAIRDMRMNFHMNAAIGKAKGTFEDACLIADQKRFLLNYARYLPSLGRLDSFIVANKGGVMSTFTGDKYEPTRVEPDKNILEGWALNSTHFICDGVGRSKMPFTELVNAAQAAKWKINVETKKFEAGTFVRVLMDSPTQPSRRYEFMVDPNKFLPVSFSSVVSQKEKISTELRISWDQSNTPLTDKQLSPKVETAPVKVLTPEEAKKLGVKPKG